LKTEKPLKRITIMIKISIVTIHLMIDLLKSGISLFLMFAQRSLLLFAKDTLINILDGNRER
jgi:hypothetical protein